MSGRATAVMPTVGCYRRGQSGYLTGIYNVPHWTESLAMPRNYECLTGAQVSQFCVSDVNSGDVFQEMWCF